MDSSQEPGTVAYTASLCGPVQPADHVASTTQGNLTRADVRVWADQKGKKRFIALPVPPILDDQAICCTITTRILEEVDPSGTIPPLEDGHECMQKTHFRRVRLFLRGEDQTSSTGFPFCVLQGEERRVVMTGREKCFEVCPEVMRMAVIAADPKTQGEWICTNAQQLHRMTCTPEEYYDEKRVEEERKKRLEAEEVARAQKEREICQAASKRDAEKAEAAKKHASR
ncbi:hypothetical protein EDD36DRAFT_421113 [Exophiala viscosa]|uniref:Uncharacterized protein n=1 Tax=Exophiala viscosa TaxID=2486360 RepID=A0AAN6DS77_9EURO|nr:hypothetical protein EDD36DRAFT_421113 [Exophiala viscosa]